MKSSNTLDHQSILDRLLSIGKRRIAVIVRVSSTSQIKNEGSIETQVRQATLVRTMFPADQIDVFYILGESAREGARRPKFDHFLERLDSGEYALVIVYDFDRLTRNSRDEGRLLEIMKRHGILLMAKGVIYDPTDPTEEMVWKMLSLISAYDNALRSFRSILAKAAKANGGRLAITLPAGMGWYDPQQASYQSAAESLGLQSYLLAADSAKVFAESKDQGRRYALPVPDGDTYRACQLLFDYMRSERSIPAVLARVKNPGNAEWPAGRRGRVPVLNKTRPGRHSPHTKVGTRVIEWEPVTPRILAKFFRRPAYYGIYSVDLRKLRGALNNHAEKIGLAKTVFIEDAFRGFATSAEYHEFRAIVANTADTRRGRRDHLRLHALPPVNCGELVEGPTGKLAPCGYRLSPVYNLPSRGNVYMSSGLCTHKQTLPFSAESAVIDLVCRCFDTAQVAEAIAAQTLHKREKGLAIAKLRADVTAREERVRTYMDHIAQLSAVVRRDPRDESSRQELNEFQQQLGVHREARDEAKRKLEREVFAAESEAPVTGKELAAVRQLAADLPRLLHGALEVVRGLPAKYEQAVDEGERLRLRELAPLVRNLLAQLIRRITVRRVGHAVHEITVEFLNGALASTTVATTGTRATQAQQAWLSHRLGSASDFSAAAVEISALLGCDGSRIRKRPWTAEEVETAVVHYRRLHEPSASPTVSVGALARFLGQSEHTVEAALLSHHRVRLEVQEDQLVVVRDERVLQEALPELGRRHVAKRMRWRLEMVMPIDSIADKFLRRQLRMAARRERRYAQDASGREFITTL